MKKILAAVLSLALLSLATPAHAAPGTPAVMVSDNPDHTGNVRALDGESLSGPVAIWVDPGGARIESIGFTLDDQAGATTYASPWNYTAGFLLTTAVLPNGTHTLRVGVHRPNGGLTRLTATFTTDNDSAPQVMVAESPDRTLNLRPLSGATLTAGQDYYIFVGPTSSGPEDAGRVKFSEGREVVETVPPFDFAETKKNGDAFPATFTAGDRTLVTSIGLSCVAIGPAQCQRANVLVPSFDYSDSFTVS